MHLTCALFGRLGGSHSENTIRLDFVEKSVKLQHDMRNRNPRANQDQNQSTGNFHAFAELGPQPIANAQADER